MKRMISVLMIGKALVPAEMVREGYPITNSARVTVVSARKAITNILGSCSVHDVKAA